MNTKSFLKISLLFLLLASISPAEEFQIKYQTTGPIGTNCYLIYGTESKEAAIIDPGWRIDTLINFINENGLILKYIFVTHGHIDHFYYVPEIKAMYPEAEFCINKMEYDGLFTMLDWIRKNYGQEWIDQMNSETDTKKYIDFDLNSLGEPDIYLEDNQLFKLGDIEIRTVICPGHSPRGTCLYTGNILFSGDVLFYRSVGRTDTQNGSKEEEIKSVRKLYSMFPDSTIVYPGHRQFTDIGSEKRENKKVTADGGEWDGE